MGVRTDYLVGAATRFRVQKRFLVAVSVIF